MAITWVCFYHFGFALGPIESQLLKMKEPGESIIDLLQLINQDMNTGTKFQNRSVTITQNFIISPSKYSFNICRQSVAQLKVIQARELTQQNERTDHARVMNMTYYTILVTAQDASFRIFVHTGMFTRNHKFRGEIKIISEIVILVHFQIVNNSKESAILAHFGDKYSGPKSRPRINWGAL